MNEVTCTQCIISKLIGVKISGSGSALTIAALVFMGKLARLVYKQGFLPHKKASFLEIVSIIKDNTNLFIKIQQIEVSLIKRTADAAVKGRSSKWEGASFVARTEKARGGCWML